VELRWDGGNVRFGVELADTFEERAKGLMFRQALGRFDGMLFIYDEPVSANFWMKNTLIPLDMIFLDEHGVVLNIHERAVPGSLKTIEGGDGVLAVLEVNGGTVKKLGIKLGAQMRHPAFAQTEPAWACQ
jgi:uncharacterized membrane protein (UPF0127 family)